MAGSPTELLSTDFEILYSVLVRPANSDCVFSIPGVDWTLLLPSVLACLFMGAFETAQAYQEPVSEDPNAALVEPGNQMTQGTSRASDFAGEDWPNFLGPRFDGTSRETGLLESWPRKGPPVKWSRTLGASYSAPVTGRGRLFLLHRLGNEEIVEAVDMETGTPIWKTAYATSYVDSFGYNGGPRSSPVLEGNFVYTFGAEGTLTCLDFETGEILWQRWVNRDFEVPQNFFGVGTSPVIAGDLVLLNAGGSGGAGVIALDKKTGQTVWKTGSDEASYSTPVIRQLHGESLGIFFTRQGLLVLETRSGEERYRYPFRARSDFSVNAASPLVIDDYVFLSAAYRAGSVLLKLNPGGLEQVWRDPLAMQNHWATSVYYQGHVYGMDGRHEAGSRFRCLEFMTGKVRWTAQQGLGRAAFLLADGNLIALGERGTLALIEANPDRYREVARAEVLQYPCWTPPVLSHGLLYVRNETRLVCLDLRR